MDQVLARLILPCLVYCIPSSNNAESLAVLVNLERARQIADSKGQCTMIQAYIFERWTGDLFTVIAKYKLVCELLVGQLKRQILFRRAKLDASSVARAARGESKSEDPINPDHSQRASTLELYSSSMRTTYSCFPFLALIRAVCPSRSCMSGSAPCSSNSRTTSVCPLELATSRAGSCWLRFRIPFTLTPCSSR